MLRILCTVGTVKMLLTLINQLQIISLIEIFRVAPEYLSVKSAGDMTSALGWRLLVTDLVGCLSRGFTLG